MDTKNAFAEHINDRIKKTVLLIKCTVAVAAVVMTALAVTLIVDLFGGKVIELEAGESLPSAAELCGESDAAYVYDDTEIDITKVGEYKIAIKYGSKTMKVKLKVKDTKAPLGAVKALYLHDGSSARPEAKDFFEEIIEYSEYTASFSGSVSIGGLGSYNVAILLRDEHGNERKYETTLSVIVDTEPPRLELPESIVGYVGEGIAYRSGVVVRDNCFGATFEVDDSKVNTKVAGIYPVTYTAIDAAGNKISKVISAYIHEKHVTQEELNGIIEKIARAQGMSKSMSKEELCKRIYEYVNHPSASASAARFEYIGFSNDSTRSDWRYEAYLTIKNGAGDCYSYFAVAKAFFEYFGIENRDIQRKKGLTSDTHYWNMVNIGTEANPRWYFFDATRYAGRFTVGGDNGCLLTQAQLDGYKASNSAYDGVYYAFDKSAYPTPQTEIINKNYNFG